MQYTIYLYVIGVMLFGLMDAILVMGTGYQGPFDGRPFVMGVLIIACAVFGLVIDHVRKDNSVVKGGP